MENSLPYLQDLDDSKLISINSIQTILLSFFRVHFNIILRLNQFPKQSVIFKLCDQNVLRISYVIPPPLHGNRKK